MENKNNTSINGENKKPALFFGITAIVVVLFIIFIGIGRGTANKESKEVLDIPTEDTSAGSVNVVKKVPSISYANALIKYKDARIQLDPSCQAFPNNLTFKNGTSIMIDNRSADTRTVKIGGLYTVKPFGFKIVKLSIAELPATLLVDCDEFQNVATVLVQE